MNKYLIILLLAFYNPSLAQVDIIIPNVQPQGLNFGDTFTLHVTSSEITGLGIIAFQFSINFDTLVVEAVGIDVNGTNTDADGWTVMPNTGIAGEIHVAGFGANPLTGSGNFIGLTFQVINPSGFTNLESTEFIFNSGSPTAIVINGSIQLPVELSSFTARVMENEVELNWITESETNNKGFEIYRSKNGSADDAKWDNIGFVKGYGTTTERREYRFIDTGLGEGVYYYRLKQIDLNGNYDYSEAVEVILDLPVEFKLYQNYPNPFNNTTNIKYSIDQSGIIQLVLYNIIGEKIIELVNSYQESGEYHLHFTADGLVAGIYYLSLSSKNKNVLKKMIYLK